MPAGIRVFSTSGILQIDENYKHFAYRAKGTLTLNGSGQGNVTVSGTTPILAYRCSSDVVLLYTTASGGSRTFYFVGSASASVDWFHFDAPTFSGGAGSGLIIKNAAGDPTFNSNQRSLRVVDYVEHSPVDTSYAETIGYTSGRTYAVVCAHNGRGMVSAPKPFDPGVFINIGHAVSSRYSGDSMIFEYYSLYTGASSSAPVYSPKGYHAVVDVTGL